MNYETLQAIIQRTKKVKIRNMADVIQELYFFCAEDADSIENYFNLFDLFDLAFEQPIWEGEEDDYHNLAVICAREDDYDTACRVLERGLKEYEYSINLLSDYLMYGKSCGRQEKSAECYSRLLEKRTEWNGRAYHFSILYLFGLVSTKEKINPGVILELIQEFKKKFPEQEESYMAEAQFYQMFNYKKEMASYQSVLEFVTSKQSPIQRTPKCDLRLADYYFEGGKHLQKAIILLDRCKRNSIEPQPSVNRNYVYLMSALCKMTCYYDEYAQQKKVIEDEEKKVQKVKEIYEDYHISAASQKDFKVYNCKSLIESFAKETGVPYPYLEDGVDVSI